MNIDCVPALIAGGGLALGAYHREFVMENWMTLANSAVAIFAGEISVRSFYFIKSYFNKSSNLIEKYSLASFFNKSEQTAIIIGAPLMLAYTWAYWNESGKFIAPLTLAHFCYRTYMCPPPIVVKQQYGRSLNGIYYGPAMAYSYYYGYFNIIFSEYKGEDFFARINRYIDANADEATGKKISVPDKRLQILIPLSGECPEKLNERGEDWITERNMPSEVEANRGGVKRRKYQNTMYRIKKPDSTEATFNVVAEYATPVKTYNEACQLSGESDLVEYKKETIKSFYETLKILVERDRSTKENVNLILYDDMNEDGTYINIAHLLLDAISGNQSSA